MNTINNNDQRYAKMYEATLAVVGEKQFKTALVNTGNRWIDIAKVWNEWSKNQLYSVLFSVFHKIFWNVYPDISADEKYMRLLTLVENEILSGDESKAAWIEWNEYVECLLDVLCEMEPCVANMDGLCFIEHFHYLQSRAKSLILYDNNSPLKFVEEDLRHESYEAVVSTIIPAAATWTRAEWVNDSNIADALESLYGVNYADSEAGHLDYNLLIRMMYCLAGTEDCDDDFLWYVSHITELPASMAKVIWPSKTEQKISEIFMAAYNKTLEYIASGEPLAYKKNNCDDPVGHFELSALKNSWLFKQMTILTTIGKKFAKQDGEIRRAVFDLQMCV